MKLKTLKDFEKKFTAIPIDILKEEARRFFIRGIKKKRNPYEMFLEFHNLTYGELGITKADLKTGALK